MKKAEIIAKYGEEVYQKRLEKSRERSKQYYQNNKEEIREKTKQYRRAHKGERAEQNRQYRQNNRERLIEYQKQWYQDNKEDILKLRKQYRQDNKEKIAEDRKHRYKANREKISEYSKQNYQKHKEERAEKRKQYYQTQNGRAVNLCCNYRKTDKKYERGECTLTPEWIIDNIFTSKCLYCGDNDWTHLGADRINNDLPHTSNNCIPACFVCNAERQHKRMSVEEFKEYRSLHPRVLGDNPEKSWEVIELESGLKVIKKKQQTP